MTRPGLSAFTLIELLVVVTIIVVLLALLTPALDKAIEQAERAVCAGNVHLFGVAVPQYAMDNRRALPSTVVWGTYPHPLMVRPLSGVQPAQWNTQAMLPYTGGATIDGAANVYTLKAPWYCPSNRADKNPANSNTAQSGVLNGVTGDPFMDIDYSYFGQVDKWNNGHCTRPEDLVSRDLASNRVLMADTLFYYTPTGSWWLNHSAQGYSVHDGRGGGPELVGPKLLFEVTGVNKLFGDGSARWKDSSEFNFPALVGRSRDEPWVSNVAQDTTGTAGAITFY